MKSDSDLLHEYVEKRSNQKVISQLHKELLDRQRELKQLSIIPNVSSVHVKEDGYIKKLGVSHPRDLFLDNFGQILASMFCPPQGTGSLVTMKRPSGTSFSQRASGTQAVNNSFAGYFAQNNNAPAIKLGSGADVAVRGDFNVQTACLGTLGNYVPSVSAGYTGGQVNFNIQVGPASVADTVREGVVFIYGPGTNNAPGSEDYTAMMRYNYTPLPVGIGEVVVAEVTVSI